MADHKLDVVGCGSMVVDLFYRTPRIIRADEKILLHAHSASAAIERTQVGGLVLNHLGWARVLGLRTGIFGKLGDDRHGVFLRDGMEHLGIRHHLTFDGSASAFATIFVDTAGDRAIYMSRGATGELTPTEVRSRHGAFIRRANLISTEISQLPLRTVLAILLFARTHSIPTILDVDVPPSDAIGSLGTRAELERVLKLATYLKPAKAAARELIAGNGRDPLKLAESIRAKYGSRAVIITEGDKGCSIAADGASVRVPAFKVKQVDSTGAGDAFLAGIFAGIRMNLPWEQTGRLANAAGAICVTRLGAFPSGFEVRDEIVDLYGAALTLPRPRAEADQHESGNEVSTVEVEEFFDIALAELATLRAGINFAAIARAVEIIRTALGRGGRVHVTGVGKPEHVARYAASLLCSVGTPATFLHATETLHGSLGQVHPRDVVIAISNSGNTDELLATATAIREQGAQLIAITGNKESGLTQLADLVIHAPVSQEGGGLGLAPRISVLGEVFVIAGLSVALEVAHGLTVEEYSRWHRAGTIGETARRIANARSSLPRP
ncbi:MAG: PfkB family carbohydrate kinase [Candidatus Binatus sp.]|uniref:PfkB family carbohydrate kinase n=1 Tax=Candidatus Binatus sp. TaxID=2811406 RepID=UPI0027194FE2|nr:PfkB family carbohydrate kinase [Candidatus Binatus sp.]MDO8434210.1 PfkB family carbohydrate kinase [Candidatus Binatus sp.]